jgi:hypothetical protein
MYSAHFGFRFVYLKWIKEKDAPPSRFGRLSSYVLYNNMEKRMYSAGTEFHSRLTYIEQKGSPATSGSIAFAS